MTQHKPNPELIFQYLEGTLSASEHKQVEALIQSDKAWVEEYKLQKNLISTFDTAPQCEPPSRIWANIKSEIRQSHIKPLWQIHLEELFRPYRVATVTACFAMFVAVWYSQMLIQPEFELVDISDVNGFSIEADTYLATHELMQDEPVTQEVLLAFYPLDNNFDEE